MTIERMQQKIINRLLDKYEKSKTFQGENQVQQSFTERVERLFPKYGDDAEYAFFCDVNEAVEGLQSGGLVTVQQDRGERILRISLCMEALEDCYHFADRIPRSKTQEWLAQIWETCGDCAVLQNYITAQRERIRQNKNAEYFSGNREEYANLLRVVRMLCENEEEVFVRDFSIRLFGDSKMFGQYAAKAGALMAQYGDYMDRESVLEECGVVATPTYVCIKGNAVIRLGEQQLKLSEIRGDIALSTTSLKELTQIVIGAERVVTVENLTSFHDYKNADDFVIYLGGFHNKTKRRFLLFLYEQNPDKQYWHFGDIDAGGFYILEHLRTKTNIPFQPLYMDIGMLEKYSGQTKRLTENDRRRLLLLQKKNGANDYAEVIAYMLAHDCKLEQEAIEV